MNLNLIDDWADQSIEQKQTLIYFNNLSKDAEQDQDKGDTEKNEEASPLTAYIKSFDSNGVMIIRFNKQIKTEGINIIAIDNSTLNLTLLNHDNFLGNISNFTWKT